MGGGMSTVKATNFQHPSSSDVNITLGADGSVVLPAGFTGGLGTNVVQTVKTDTFTTTSLTAVDVTGLAVTITPSSATSKILISFSLVLGLGSTQTGFYFALTDSSNVPLVEGDTNGSRLRGLIGARTTSYIANETGIISGSYLWSPATTSAVTAKIRTHAFETQGLHINRDATYANSTAHTTGVSQITAIEVAA